jgi:hypothetical protein
MMSHFKRRTHAVRRLEPHQIAEEFNTQKNSVAATWEKSGLSGALRDLSLALADMKTAGLDVSLEIFGSPSEQAFGMFPSGGLTVPVSGILREGHMHRLLAIATKVSGEGALQLALSEFDVRFNGADAQVKDGVVDSKVRATIFDLAKDPEALIKFQREVIRHASRNEAVDNNDAGEAFDKKDALRKQSLKLAPKA